MRAAIVTAFGPPDVLQIHEVASPQPGPGQVLVDVDAVDVLDVDTKLRGGLGTDWFPHRPPYIPGGGVAGTVAATGDRSDASLIGQRVLAQTVDAVTGGYAEQALASAEKVVPIPDELDAVTAAALVHDGLTAFALLDRFPVSDDDRVLVLGAAGGAGSLLVQMAANAGATVVGAARGRRKLDTVRQLDVDAVVDYGERDWVAAAHDHLPDGATLVFDGVGGELGRTALDQLTAKGGRFSAHGAASGGFSVMDRDEVYDRLGVTVIGIEVPQAASAAFQPTLERVVAAAAAGRLRPVVGLTRSLDHAADVHRAREAREVIGTAVLVVKPS